MALSLGVVGEVRLGRGGGDERHWEMGFFTSLLLASSVFCLFRTVVDAPEVDRGLRVFFSLTSGAPEEVPFPSSATARFCVASFFFRGFLGADDFARAPVVDAGDCKVNFSPP